VTYKLAKQPAKRADGVPWEAAAPGLYDDGEALVKVGDIYAAVSVEHRWLENGSGVNFVGTARWCDAKGETNLTPDGQHVETQISVTADPQILAEHSLDDLKKDVLLTLLGEEPETLKDDGEGRKVPVHGLSPTARLNASIVHAASVVQALRQSSDPAALLG
jgi:hypothetical protein